MGNSREAFWEGQSALKAELACIEADYKAAKEKYESDMHAAYQKAVAHDVETCPLANGTGRCRGLYVCAQFTILGPCVMFEKEYRRLTEKYALREVGEQDE